MLKVSHYNNIYFVIYFLSCAHLSHMKCLFTNIQKQKSILKSSLLFKKNLNYTRILRIKNAKFSGYCFNVNPNIQQNFQIGISAPLKQTPKKHLTNIEIKTFVNIL